MSDKEYLAKFRQGSGPLQMNAIDYFLDHGLIIKHSWAMGGETKEVVSSVPAEIKGYFQLTI